MCGSSSSGARPGDHPGPARAAQRDHRRHVRRAGRRDREAPRRSVGPADHDPRRGPGLHRRQRPRRFPRRPCRATRRTSRSGGCCARWPTYEMPLVAAVHGNASASARPCCSTATWSIAEEGARFSMPFVDLGLVPEAASSLLLPRLAGRRRAARYLLLGEPFGVDEALEIGLVSHVAAQASSTRRSNRSSQRLLAKPPEALRLTQRLLRPARARNLRADGAGERAISPSGLSSAEVERGDHRILREAKAELQLAVRRRRQPPRRASSD